MAKRELAYKTLFEIMMRVADIGFSGVFVFALLLAKLFYEVPEAVCRLERYYE